MYAFMRRALAGGRLALVSVTIAAALLIPGVASAGSSNFHAFTNSQFGNNFCGSDHPEYGSLAFVELTKKGPWLTVRTSFDGTPAQASHSYDVFIYSGNTCEWLGYAGSVTTNAFAVANVTFPKFKLPAGTTSVVVAVRDESMVWSLTPIVP